MLKRAEKNVLYTIMGTTLIGLIGMRTSFSKESPQKDKQSMEEQQNIKPQSDNKLLIYFTQE